MQFEFTSFTIPQEDAKADKVRPSHAKDHELKYQVSPPYRDSLNLQLEDNVEVSQVSSSAEYNDKFEPRQDVETTNYSENCLAAENDILLRVFMTNPNQKSFVLDNDQGIESLKNETFSNEIIDDVIADDPSTCSLNAEDNALEILKQDNRTKVGKSRNHDKELLKNNDLSNGLEYYHNTNVGGTGIKERSKSQATLDVDPIDDTHVATDYLLSKKDPPQLLLSYANPTTEETMNVDNGTREVSSLQLLDIVTKGECDIIATKDDSVINTQLESSLLSPHSNKEESAIEKGVALYADHDDLRNNADQSYDELSDEDYEQGPVSMMLDKSHLEANNFSKITRIASKIGYGQQQKNNVKDEITSNILGDNRATKSLEQRYEELGSNEGSGKKLVSTEFDTSHLDTHFVERSLTTNKKGYGQEQYDVRNNTMKDVIGNDEPKRLELASLFSLFDEIKGARSMLNTSNDAVKTEVDTNSKTNNNESDVLETCVNNEWVFNGPRQNDNGDLNSEKKDTKPVTNEHSLIDFLHEFADDHEDYKFPLSECNSTSLDIQSYCGNNSHEQKHTRDGVSMKSNDAKSIRTAKHSRDESLIYLGKSQDHICTSNNEHCELVSENNQGSEGDVTKIEMEVHNVSNEAIPFLLENSCTEKSELGMKIQNTVSSQATTKDHEQQNTSYNETCTELVIENAESSQPSVSDYLSKEMESTFDSVRSRSLVTSEVAVVQTCSSILDNTVRKQGGLESTAINMTRTNIEIEKQFSSKGDAEAALYLGDEFRQTSITRRNEKNFKECDGIGSTTSSSFDESTISSDKNKTTLATRTQTFTPRFSLSSGKENTLDPSSSFSTENSNSRIPLPPKVIRQNQPNEYGNETIPTSIYSPQIYENPRAGQRLYLQGLEQEKKKLLERKKAMKEKEKLNRLELEAKSYMPIARAQSTPNFNLDRPVHERLFDLAKQRKNADKKIELNYDKANDSSIKPQIQLLVVSRSMTPGRIGDPGHRLYNLAQKKRLLEQERKVQKIEKDANYKPPKLRLATRKYTPVRSRSRIDELRSIHQRLYDLSKRKKDNEQPPSAPNLEKYIPEGVAENRVHRFYGRSRVRVREGRERRENIEKKLAPRLRAHSKKISVKDGIAIYERGMKQKVIMEKRIMERSIEPYCSPLIHNHTQFDDRSQTSASTRGFQTPNGKRRSHTSTAFGRSRSQTPIGRSRSQTPTAFGRSRSQTPTTFGRSRSQTPSAFGRSRSQTPSASCRSRSQTPKIIGRSRSQIPSAIGRSKSQIPTAIGRSRSQIPTIIGRSRSQSRTAFGRSDTYDSIRRSRSTTRRPRSSTPNIRSQSRERSQIPSTIGRSRSPIPTAFGRSRSQSRTTLELSDTSDSMRRSRSTTRRPRSSTLNIRSQSPDPYTRRDRSQTPSDNSFGEDENEVIGTRLTRIPKNCDEMSSPLEPSRLTDGTEDKNMQSERGFPGSKLPMSARMHDHEITLVSKGYNEDVLLEISGQDELELALELDSTSSTIQEDYIDCGSI